MVYLENEAIKLFLFPYNKALLIELISVALEHFEAWQKEIGNEHRRFESITWEVPSIRYFNELYSRQEIETHALGSFL